MPKIVDHEERRPEISRVTLRSIAREGLDKVTIRGISKAGGFSSGVLAHYFTNKEEMINFAFSAVADDAYAKIDAKLPSCKSSLEKIRIIVDEHLPDAAGDTEAATSYAAVCLAFWSSATHGSILATRFQEIYERWRHYLCLYIEEAIANGTIAPVDNVHDIADMIIVMTDGLLVSFTISPQQFPKTRRSRMIHAILSSLLPKSGNIPT